MLGPPKNSNHARHEDLEPKTLNHEKHGDSRKEDRVASEERTGPGPTRSGETRLCPLLTGNFPSVFISFSVLFSVVRGSIRIVFRVPGGGTTARSPGRNSARETDRLPRQCAFFPLALKTGRTQETQITGMTHTST
jgi:hypothetical protein